MLVFRLRAKESVLVGNNIRVKIVHIDSETGICKLGFDAPRDVLVDREHIRQERVDKGELDESWLVPQDPKYQT